MKETTFNFIFKPIGLIWKKNGFYGREVALKLGINYDELKQILDENNNFKNELADFGMLSIIKNKKQQFVFSTKESIFLLTTFLISKGKGKDLLKVYLNYNTVMKGNKPSKETPWIIAVENDNGVIDDDRTLFSMEMVMYIGLTTFEYESDKNEAKIKSFRKNAINYLKENF